MRSILEPITSALRRTAGALGGLLPSPPSDEAPPPDVDGRRPMTADQTEVKLKAQMRDGQGAGSHR